MATIRCRDKYIRGFAAVLCFSVIFAFFSVGAYALEAGTKVFIAGNPDMYPIEYYSEETGMYEGVMPEIYKHIAEGTGYDFKYIDTEGLDRQEHMAKNGQVDIVSAYVRGDIDGEYIKKEYKITEFKDQSDMQTVCIGFTEIASPEIISEVTAALDEITDKEKLELINSCTIGVKYQSRDQSSRGFLAVIGLIGIAGTAALLILITRKKIAQKSSEDDQRYYVGDMNYYRACFAKVTTGAVKSLYYTAYIAFNKEKIEQRYGAKTAREIQNMAMVFIKNDKGADDFAAMIKDGIFMLLYQQNNQEKAQKYIQTLVDELNLMAAMEDRYEYGNIFHAGIYALDSDVSCSSEVAVYNAKQGYLQAVKDNTPYVISTTAIVNENRQTERLHHRIAKAINDGEFELYIQYVVDRSGSICGGEAVSRWANPQEGLLTPGKFIGPMIQTGLIDEHDFYIFSKVCKQLEDWQKSGLGDISLSCNFTRQAISAPDFPLKLAEIARKYDFKYDKAIIEITEDSFAKEKSELIKNINACKEMGFGLALDDIGSGYSSMQDMYSCVVDYVKLDREIIANCEEQRGQMFLEGLVKFAHSMGLKILCEGVETQQQNEVALAAGCDFIQGYYYSRVLPQKEADKLLRQKYKRA